MAYDSHLLSYRSETTADLITEKATLKAQRSLFTSQAAGDRSFMKDLRLCEERLQAVNYVLRERNPPAITKPDVNHSVGVVDFSNVQ